ncbi:MAG: putative manganese transporter [Myxococcota bacterium]|nr:putative manganese transporter [Myxococcota bacterium]
MIDLKSALLAPRDALPALHREPQNKPLNRALENSEGPNIQPAAVLGILSLVWLLPVDGIVREALQGAYFDVTLYVAVTLVPLQFLGRFLSFQNWRLRLNVVEVPIAALLGALPGCGGAIVVTSAFAKGKLSFGAVVAVLAATMGDAAFLMMSKAPSTLLTVMALSFAFGTASGWLVNIIHHPDFLRPIPINVPLASLETEKADSTSSDWLKQSLVILWCITALIGGFVVWAPDFTARVTNMNLAHIEPFIATLGVILSLSLLTTKTPKEPCRSSHNATWKLDQSLRVVYRVTLWVVAAFILFELIGIVVPSAATVLSNIPEMAAPSLAVVVGLIPSCGPQVIFTELYLGGHLGFSALIANAISNDGDALFPMLAVAPRAALCASLYTMIPALTAGYIAYLWA